MAICYWAGSSLFGPLIGILFAIISRLLLTGCMHEDGLADFFDGFGGGHSRDQILTIMKDSHIGTFGVVSLFCYFATLIAMWYKLAENISPTWFLAALDPLGRTCSAAITLSLPYARDEDGSKAKVVYQSLHWHRILISFGGGILPILLLSIFTDFRFLLSLPVGAIVTALIARLMIKRIGGYTGDCCGAIFLLSELAALMFSSSITASMVVG